MAGSSVFQWGDMVRGSLSSYEFMFFRGVRYALYDCVFVRSGLSEPSIGKLMRLYEERGVKMVRIRWFFRREELPFSVKKDIPPGKDGKELFVAQGSIKGVENENVVEVLLGKATVLCTARCRNNPVPSELQVNSADHFFSRVYDCFNKKLLKMEKMEKSLALKIFNKPEWLQAAQSVSRDDCRSPTSVRDFDVVAKQLPPAQKSSVKLKVERPSMEPLRPPLAVKRPSTEPARLPPAVKKPSLESAKNQFKSIQQVPKHAVVVLRRDLQSQNELIVLD